MGSSGEQAAQVVIGLLGQLRVVEGIEQRGGDAVHLQKYIFVEQDNCFGEYPFECLKKSYQYLTSIGLK